nr:hypothetical protein [Brevundimonas naejangsanensis]
MTCAACETSRRSAEAAGHRDWRDGVCWDHAAFDLDSPEGRALMADLPPEPQPDLFGDAA